MSRSRSSGRWLREHHTDPYVQRARREGYRSRAVYKLDEIQQRDRLLRPGMRVADLGAAPGSWSQYVAQYVGEQGRVIALDVLPMDPLAGVEVVQGDFRDEAVLAQLQHTLDGQPLDLVLSDMAPNMSGIRAVDQPAGMYLVELATEFTRHTLKPEGNFLTKVFQGEGFDELLRGLKRDFRQVITRKPESSRSRSPELYLLARGFRSPASTSSR